MIVYQLRCAKNHEFEAWFKDSATFDSQCPAGDIECPVCGNTKIVKAPMAPRISTKQVSDAAASGRAHELAEQILKSVNALRKHVEENCDYVGEKFADEARRIHYGETEERPIYGEATKDEAKNLDDEGIEVHRLPPLPRRDD